MFKNLVMPQTIDSRFNSARFLEALVQISGAAESFPWRASHSPHARPCAWQRRKNSGDFVLKANTILHTDKNEGYQHLNLNLRDPFTALGGAARLEALAP